MVETIDTVIIGAGHAGLSTSYMLKQQGREHTVLDKAGRPGNAWRSERWDSFTFVTPNWSFQIPGGEYDGPDPDGFMTRDELADRFDRYVEKHELPLTYHARVTAVQPRDGKGFLVRTETRDYQARNVVAANGWFQVGKKPDFASKIPADILQLHSSSYRNPQSLPPGAVLVIGSAQSGAQIVEDLYRSGRKVYLATGTAPHAPRRYRGKDILRWFIDSGFVDQTWEQMQYLGHPFVAPMVSGKNGGHALNLHQFYREGVILLGHARDYVDGKILFAPDLKTNLDKADTGQKLMINNIDDYIRRAGVDAPLEEIPTLTDGYQAPEITSLDLRREAIRTIIWSSGFSYDASIFQFPVLKNQSGLPDAPQGASRTYPGLYFAGFPFLPGLISGLVGGITQTATYIAEKISEKQRG